MKEFKSSCLKSFHIVILKKVIMMAVTKKCMQVVQTSVYETKLIYTRVMILQQARDINMKEVFSYELSPVTSSKFNDND